MGVAIFSPSVPARATVINAGSLVLNNGIILVHNLSSRTRTGIAIIHWDSGIMQENVMAIAPGDIWLTHKCCYAAGTRYTLSISTSHEQNFAFTPHLCFRNGIPYGYAELTINDESNNKARVDVVERHGTCYMGEL